MIRRFPSHLEESHSGCQLFEDPRGISIWTPVRGWTFLQHNMLAYDIVIAIEETPKIPPTTIFVRRKELVLKSSNIP